MTDSPSPKPSPKTTHKAIQVLFAEDGRPSRMLLERDLPVGERVLVALKRGDKLPDFLGEENLDVLVQELEVGGVDDEESLRLVRGSGTDTDLVIVSATAKEATGEPAEASDDAPYEYLTRPLSPSELRRLVDGGGRAPASQTSRGRSEDPGPEAERASGAEIPQALVATGMIGCSKALVELLERARRVAASSASVLIQGETGTGKSLVARAVHEASGRRDKPFVVVNCAALTEQLLESELFGHEKGSFTGAAAAKPGLFEVASGGTLFLDEVGEMSPPMQAKLLTTLDTGEIRRVGGTKTHKVDVRIVAATNKDLEEEVREDRFREDLLFRLNVVALAVPPLRERPEDIPLLVEHFLDRLNPPAASPRRLSDAALRRFLGHAWPGNVRELANTLEGLVLLAPGPVIRAEDLPLGFRPGAPAETAEEAGPPPPMTEIERRHIERTLHYTEGKKAPAARLLGIDVKTLNSKIKTYGLTV